MVGKIPISQFKSNQIHMKESKLIKVEESKGRSSFGSSPNRSPNKSPCKFGEALRLPNITVKTQGLGGSISPSGTKRSDGYSSPTDILSDAYMDDL